MPGPLELRPLRETDEESFRAAVREFEAEVPPWQFAFEFEEAESFPDYVRMLETWSRGENISERFVPNTFFVGVVDGVIVGRLSLRHRLNDFLRREGGHIGYGVVPSHRRKGYATAMLRLALPHCARLGIARALLTCDVENHASRQVIERCGGVFERITDYADMPVQKRHYWITVRGT
jgi:predicted acetyltransferase